MFGIWHRTSSYPSLDALRPAGLQALHEAWQRARGFSDVPLASDMPVNAVQAVLPNMALVALAPACEEARYLVFGPALRLLLGRNPTGLAIRDAYPRTIAREVAAALDRVRRERRPLFYQCDFRILGREFGYVRLMLPLRDARGAIVHVALGIYPVQADLRHASQWQSAVAELEEKRLGQAGTAAEWHAMLSGVEGLDPEPSPLSDVWLV